MTTSRYGHAGSRPSSSPAGSSTGGSWSVAGSWGSGARNGGTMEFTPNQIWPPSSAGPYGPPTSKASSTASSVRPGGSTASTSSMPRPATNPAPGIPRGSTVLMRPMSSSNRWSDGPALSVREGESIRKATLLVLQAPLPPALRPPRAPEAPQRRRMRYLEANRGDVSDPDL